MLVGHLVDRILKLCSSIRSHTRQTLKGPFVAIRDSRIAPHFSLTASRQGHFFGFAFYLDRSRDARPLPRGLTGHVAHPLRSILHRGLPGALLCAAFSLAWETIEILEWVARRGQMG